MAIRIFSLFNYRTFMLLIQRRPQSWLLYTFRTFEIQFLPAMYLQLNFVKKKHTKTATKAEKNNNKNSQWIFDFATQ